MTVSEDLFARPQGPGTTAFANELAGNEVSGLLDPTGNLPLNRLRAFAWIG